MQTMLIVPHSDVCSQCQSQINLQALRAKYGVCDMPDVKATGV